MKRDLFRLAALSLVLVIIVAFSGYASVYSRITTREQIEPNDLESMKIIRWDSEMERRHRALRYPLDQEAIGGILTLIKNAKQARYPVDFGETLDFDYIMQVKLKNGELIEVPYVTRFITHFGNFDSEMLKEALYSLTDYLRGNIIHFRDGKILEVTKFRSSEKRGKVVTHVNKEGQIIMDLRLEEDGKVIIRDTRAVRYGETLLYDYEGQGYIIINIFYPYPHR